MDKTYLVNKSLICFNFPNLNHWSLEHSLGTFLIKTLETKLSDNFKYYNFNKKGFYIAYTDLYSFVCLSAHLVYEQMEPEPKLRSHSYSNLLFGAASNYFTRNTLIC
jgi:hypothetical protein